MSDLTTAIVIHDLVGIQRVVREQPWLASERVHDRLPIEWAAATGNPMTHGRVNRLLGTAATNVDHRRLLRDFLVMLSRTNYFGAVAPAKAARRAWEQIHEGTVHVFSKDEPDFRFDVEQMRDLEVLIEQARVLPKRELEQVAEAVQFIDLSATTRTTRSSKFPPSRR